MYKIVKNITGKQVITLFKQYSVIDYVMTCYEAPHTTSTNYIIEGIDLFRYKIGPKYIFGKLGVFRIGKGEWRRNPQNPPWLIPAP